MKSTNNILTEGLSGKIKQIVFRQRFGKTIVSKTPQSRKAAPSSAQQNIRTSFKDASIYAKAALTDAATGEAYRAKAKPGQSAYNVAIADFFKAPVIGDIDSSNYSNQAGSRISVTVTDDFKVNTVMVKITKTGGALVEEGAAVLQADGLHWQYNATVLNGTVTGNTISITATDMPGHAVNKQKTV